MPVTVWPFLWRMTAIHHRLDVLAQRGEGPFVDLVTQTSTRAQRRWKVLADPIAGVQSVQVPESIKWRNELVESRCTCLMLRSTVGGVIVGLDAHLKSTFGTIVVHETLPLRVGTCADQVPPGQIGSMISCTVEDR